MRITPQTYEKLREHSKTYYDIETYDIIITNLIEFYAKHNEKKWFI